MLSGAVSPSDIYQQRAHHELGLWRDYPPQIREEDTHYLAGLYANEFHLPYETAVRAVQDRMNATRENLIAAQYAVQGDHAAADAHLMHAEKLLVEHFRILGSKIEGR